MKRPPTHAHTYVRRHTQRQRWQTNMILCLHLFISVFSCCQWPRSNSNSHKISPLGLSSSSLSPLPAPVLCLRPPPPLILTPILSFVLFRLLFSTSSSSYSSSFSSSSSCSYSSSCSSSSSLSSSTSSSSISFLLPLPLLVFLHVMGVSDLKFLSLGTHLMAGVSHSLSVTFGISQYTVSVLWIFA